MGFHGGGGGGGDDDGGVGGRASGSTSGVIVLSRVISSPIKHRYLAREPAVECYAIVGKPHAKTHMCYKYDRGSSAVLSEKRFAE